MYKPLYSSRCFSLLPKFIRHVLTKETPMGLPESVLEQMPHEYDTVVLFVLDGLGWALFERFADRFPFLRRCMSQGVASRITSQFPSTTAAHMTTLHTGVPAAQSGVVEWWYYEPVVLDRVFAPLLHSTREEGGVKALDPRWSPQLFPSETLYRTLGHSGVDTHCFMHRSYAHSAFSNQVCRGAKRHAFRTPAEAMINAVECVSSKKAGEKTYLCVYIDTIDGLSHSYGPNSKQVEGELEALFAMMEAIVAPGLLSRRDTLVMVTADHGQTEVNGEEAIYLDRLVPALESWSARTADGQHLAPAGGKRDMFLYIDAPYLDEAFETLSEVLEGRAAVMRGEEMFDEGFFGPEASQRLRERVGDLVILPGPNELVWWWGQGHFDVSKRRGSHGGLSAEELFIPLLTMSGG